MQEHARTLTGTEGRFELSGLSGLTYLLTCEPSLEYLMTKPIRVPGGSTDVEIRLEPSPEIVLTLADAEGRPVGGARLDVQYSDFQLPRAYARNELDDTVSDHEGVIRLRGLDPRRLVILDVAPPEARSDLRAIHREKWRMKSGELRFEVGRDVKGIVVDRAGEPLRGERVEWMAPDGAWPSRLVMTDEAGRFTMRGLPAGTIELYAAVAGLVQDVDRPETLTQVVAGQGEVRIEVDRGASATVRVEQWPGGAMMRAELFERPGPDDDVRRRASSDIDGSGQVTFHGLRPDKFYTLWVEGLSGRRYVHVTDIVVAPGVRSVGMQQGKEVRGRLVPPDGVKVEVVQVQLVDRWGTRVFCDGSGLDFLARGVPDGPWTVHAWADGEDGGEYYGSGPASPAEPAEVQLRPE
jgi:hypothetical protein